MTTAAATSLPRSARPTRRVTPTLRTERAWQRAGHRLVAGMDEVGRGALAGPVSVGVVVVDEGCRSAPSGVRDSKLLTPSNRVRLVPRIQRWAFGCAVGHAGPEEIDEVGIIAALRLAGRRALAALPVTPDLVILDGNHDWLTPPETVGLLAFAHGPAGDTAAQPLDCVPVTTVVKADLTCSSVAAASVLAKVERDATMVALSQEHPAFGWAVNKGYAAPEHLVALREHGPCEVHRRSWRLGQVIEHGDEPGPPTVDGEPLTSATHG